MSAFRPVAGGDLECPVPFPASRAKTHAAGTEDEERPLVRELKAARPRSDRTGEINVESNAGTAPTAVRGHPDSFQKGEAGSRSTGKRLGKGAALGRHSGGTNRYVENEPKRGMASATANFLHEGRDVVAAIKSELCEFRASALKAQIAYVLATVDHETAHNVSSL